MINRKRLLSLAVFFLAATVLFAASPATGRWSMTADTADGSRPFVLVVTDTDGKLAAVFEGAEGMVQVKETKFENNTLMLTLDVNGAVVTMELKVDGDKMDGTWKGGENSGKVSGTRT